MPGFISSQPITVFYLCLWCPEMNGQKQQDQPPDVFHKKVLLKVLPNSQENTCEDSNTSFLQNTSGGCLHIVSPSSCITVISNSEWNFRINNFGNDKQLTMLLVYLHLNISKGSLILERFCAYSDSSISQTWILIKHFLTLSVLFAKFFVFDSL